MSVAGLVLAAALLGCAEDQPESATEGIDVDVLTRLTLQEELRIGSLEDPDYGFSRIRGVDVDRDGQVYVFDAQDQQIRVYSPDGRLLRRMGGAGEGPGEFRGSSVQFGVVGDAVWAMEWDFGGPGRLTRFDRNGEVLSARRVQEVVFGTRVTGAVSVAPAFVDAQGLFVSDLNPFAVLQLAGNPDSVRVPRVRFDNQGAIVDTVGWYTRPVSLPEAQIISVGASEYVVPRPTFDEPLNINLVDGRIHIERPVARTAVEGVFRVTRLGFSNDTIYTRTFRYTPVPYQEEQLDRSAGIAARPFARAAGMVVIGPGQGRRMQRRQQDSARAHAALRREMPFPEFQLPVRGEREFNPNHLGSDGSLWLRREDTGADTFRWIVLDVDGLPVGEVHLPRDGFEIAWSDSETLWAIEPDLLEVPWLVRYRIAGGAER